MHTLRHKQSGFAYFLLSVILTARKMTIKKLPSNLHTFSGPFLKIFILKL